MLEPHSRCNRGSCESSGYRSAGCAGPWLGYHGIPQRVSAKPGVALVASSGASSSNGKLWGPQLRAQGPCGRSSLPLSDAGIAASGRTEGRPANVKGVEPGQDARQIVTRHTCPDDGMVLPARCRSGSRHWSGARGAIAARILGPVRRLTKPLAEEIADHNVYDYALGRIQSSIIICSLRLSLTWEVLTSLDILELKRVARSIALRL